MQRNGGTTMKEFNLNEYLANPKKVVTRDGDNVRIICTDARGDYPIIALVEKPNKASDILYTYTKGGYFYVTENPSPFDLFFAPEKHEGWVNIFKGTDGNSYIGHYSRIFESKEDAEKAGIGWDGYITVKVEWEE